MTVELVPTQTSFRLAEEVAVELRCSEPVRGVVRVEHLTDAVSEYAVDLDAGNHRIGLNNLPRGGYSVSLTWSGGEVDTAIDVLADPFERPRYGFLANFAPGRDDISQTGDDLRRLHLNVVQFYDWMYRHAELVGPDDEFTDALGRSLSHVTTRALIREVHAIGAVAMGYAAVYGVGPDYADAHPDQLLYRNDDVRWMLGDFLAIADPTPGRPWLVHFLDELADAVTRMGFSGFHLDQYGWPKLARRASGDEIDLAATFPAMIAAVQKALPGSRRIFNNVNDFPTETTTAAPQDATYIEVWSPSDTYADLGQLIDDARRLAPARPVILAAYLEPFADEPVERAEAAAQLTMATILAHGGHHLLCGERHGVLVDPYYANYHRVDETTFALLRRHLDAAVAIGDLLYDDGPVVTRSWYGGINEELSVEAPVPVGRRGEAGELWVIVRRSSTGLTVHLIDLSDQADSEWNTGKQPLTACTGVELEVKLPNNPASIAHVAPAETCRARSLVWKRQDDRVRVEVPPFTGWSVTHVRY